MSIIVLQERTEKPYEAGERNAFPLNRPRPRRRPSSSAVFSVASAKYRGTASLPKGRDPSADLPLVKNAKSGKLRPVPGA